MEEYPKLPQFIRDQLTLGKRVVEFCFRSLYIFELRQEGIEFTRLDVVDDTDKRRAAFKRGLLAPPEIQTELWQRGTLV